MSPRTRGAGNGRILPGFFLLRAQYRGGLGTPKLEPQAGRGVGRGSAPPPRGVGLSDRRARGKAGGSGPGRFCDNPCPGSPWRKVRRGHAWSSPKFLSREGGGKRGETPTCPQGFWESADPAAGPGGVPQPPPRARPAAGAESPRSQSRSCCRGIPSPVPPLPAPNKDALRDGSLQFRAPSPPASPPYFLVGFL